MKNTLASFIRSSRYVVQPWTAAERFIDLSYFHLFSEAKMHYFDR